MDRRFPLRSAHPVFWLLLVLTLTSAVWLAPASRVAFAQESAAETAVVPGENQDSLFLHIVKSAGPVFGGLLLLLSVSLVALIVMLALDLRMAVAIPPAFIGRFTDAVNQRQFKEAFDLAKADSSFVARVLTGGMSRLQYGIEDARDAAENTVESIKSSKDQLNNYVAVIGSLGPLIGLVGTVFGMILSFKVLSRSAKVDAPALAGGISHALVITMLGIGLAVPGVFFNAFFKNRITRLTMDTANLADDLLTQMYHFSKKPSGAGTVVGGPDLTTPPPARVPTAKPVP